MKSRNLQNALAVVPHIMPATDPLAVLSAQTSSVALYMAGLSESARRSMEVCLRRAERIIQGLSNTPGLPVRWERLRFTHLEMLKDEMQRQGFAPATINTTLCALRGVARQAWRLRLPEMEPADYQLIRDVKSVKGGRVREGRALSGEELTRLMDSCAGAGSVSALRDLAACALMAGLGLRISEAASLPLAAYTKAAARLEVLGKGQRQRSITFSDPGTRRALALWLEQRGQEPGHLLCPVTKAGVISIRRMSNQALYNALKRRGRVAGIRDFSPHDLRRTFATGLIEESGDISAVQRLMGHSSVVTTIIYDMRGERAKDRAMRRVHLRFRPARKPARSITEREEVKKLCQP